MQFNLESKWMFSEMHKTLNSMYEWSCYSSFHHELNASQAALMIYTLVDLLMYRDQMQMYQHKVFALFQKSLMYEVFWIITHTFREERLLHLDEAENAVRIVFVCVCVGGVCVAPHTNFVKGESLTSKTVLVIPGRP